ncbi:hypothetical protein EJ02DRAFT_428708 [Clathrospora elynae]|uniref:Uncharacterized protein n=1 Tax=Clathrospora elynae TaxID=706981 RepID=A0A6A5S698_9PLEO|nr:hypothetical protein EJ02DRAFT_428708 [Clathrospora elynae]
MSEELNAQDLGEGEDDDENADEDADEGDAEDKTLQKKLKGFRREGRALQTSYEDKQTETLFGFISGTEFGINLLVDDGWITAALDKQEWECNFVVPIIFPTLQRLAATGAKVKIRLEDGGCELAVADGGGTLEDFKRQFEKVGSFK